MIDNSLVFAFSSCTDTNCPLFFCLFMSECFQNSTPLICNFSNIYQKKALQGHGGNLHGVGIYSEIIFPVPRAQNLSLPLKCKEKYTALNYFTCQTQTVELLQNTHFEWVTHPETAGEWDSSGRSSWGLFLVLIPSTCCCWTRLKWQKPEFFV